MRDTNADVTMAKTEVDSFKSRLKNANDAVKRIVKMLTERIERLERAQQAEPKPLKPEKGVTSGTQTGEPAPRPLVPAATSGVMSSIGEEGDDYILNIYHDHQNSGDGRSFW